MVRPMPLSAAAVPQAVPHWSSRRPLPLRAPEGEGGSLSPETTRRILIVEDEYFVGLDIERWLIGAGHRIVGIATSAREAVALATAHRPELIIMDIHLVGSSMDGVAAAKEIFATTGIRSLFASAYTDPEVRGRAAAARPLGWLPKPFGRLELLRALAAAGRELES